MARDPLAAVARVSRPMGALRSVSIAACAAALTLPAFASAQAVFTSQERRVRATSESEALLWEEGTNPFPPDNDPPAATYVAEHADETQAPDLGSFSESASSIAPPAVGPVVPDASASASQTSTLAPDSITASGTFSALADSEFIGQPDIATLNALLQPPIPYLGGIVQASESAHTAFSIDFDLNVPTPYHLVGNVAHTPGTIGQVPHIAAGSASIELIGPAGSVAAVSLTPVGGSEDLDALGVLAPGSYTLRAEGSGATTGRCDLVGCADPTMSGSFDLTLTLTAAPVPGPSRGWTALLGVTLAAVAAVALRRA